MLPGKDCFSVEFVFLSEDIGLGEYQYHSGWSIDGGLFSSQLHEL